MPKETRQPFTPLLGELVARKWFTFNGKDYFPGDDFPWEKLGVPQRKLRQMYEAGRLRPKEGTVPQPTKEKEPTPKKTEEKEPTPKKTEKKPTPKRTPQRGRKARAKQQGGGKAKTKKKKSRKTR